MKLTEKEERMLKGDMGRGVQCAMEVLVKMGELLSLIHILSEF